MFRVSCAYALGIFVCALGEETNFTALVRSFVVSRQGVICQPIRELDLVFVLLSFPKLWACSEDTVKAPKPKYAACCDTVHCCVESPSYETPADLSCFCSVPAVLTSVCTCVQWFWCVSHRNSCQRTSASFQLITGYFREMR